MIYRVHRAKVWYRCSKCMKLIEPGTRYTVATTPPPQKNGKGWIRRKVCKRCRKIQDDQIQ
jgi:hypothetical protein